MSRKAPGPYVIEQESFADGSSVFRVKVGRLWFYRGFQGDADGGGMVSGLTYWRASAKRFRTRERAEDWIRRDWAEWLASVPMTTHEITVDPMAL